MKDKAGKFVLGLHFQFLTLVLLIAGAVLGAQLVYDTVGQLREARQQRLEAAMQVTNTLARSLENRFETLLPEEIERILASISLRGNIATLSVVDLASGVVLDSDPDTAPKALPGPWKLVVRFAISMNGSRLLNRWFKEDPETKGYEASVR